MRTVNRQSGFTLIEIILALALTAMLLSLLSTGMYAVMNDWERDTQSLDDSLDETVAMLQIERALQGAFPHSFRDMENLTRYVYFEGERDTLSWVSTVSPQRSGGLTAWYLDSNSEEGVSLRLAAAASDNPSERLENAQPRILLPNYTATFAYLYEELDFSKQWRDDWPARETMTLPLAVHVRLTPIDADSGQEALDIIARIRANSHRSLRPAFGGSPALSAGSFSSPQLGGQ